METESSASESVEASSEAVNEVTETTEATVVNTDGDAVSETMYADKFKSVSDLENSYKELQSTFSKKLGAFSGAPENGEYTFNEGIEVADNIQEWAKENNFSNEALNELAELNNKIQTEQQEAFVQEAKEKLGKDADTRIRNVNDWARANFGEDSLGIIDKMVSAVGADGVEFFESAMKKSQGTAPAPAQASTPTYDKDTINQMRFAMDENSGQRKMSIDPAYRAKVEDLEAKLYASR